MNYILTDDLKLNFKCFIDFANKQCCCFNKLQLCMMHITNILVNYTEVYLLTRPAYLKPISHYSDSKMALRIFVIKTPFPPAIKM